MQALTSRKTTLLRHQREGLRFLVLTDLYYLCREVLGLTKLTPGFHRPLCEFFQTTPYRRNLYLLSRYFYKTSILTEAANTQRILKNPDLRVLLASNKAENAEAMLRGIKGHLQNPVLLWLFPEILFKDPPREAPSWTTSAITVKRKRRNREATVETIGTAGELTSKHYDHGTFDDLVGFENSQTRDQIEATIRWWKTSQGLFHAREATQDVIGTPWDHRDLYMWLLEQKEKHGIPLGVYKKACWEDPDGSVPFTPSKDTRATFPEEFPIPVLLERKREQGSVIFAAQMLVTPVDDETAMFPRSKAIVVGRDSLPQTEHFWKVMSVDPAISEETWADFSAICVGGFDEHGRLYILDLRHGRWSESELVRQIYDAYARTPGIRAIGFEAVSFAKIFRRLFTIEGEKRGTYLPVTALERDTRVTKGVRIRSLQPFWENGNIILAADLPALEEFLEEAERYRGSKRSHDDMLDAMADLLQLRIRPQAGEVLLDDPELLERQRFETDLLQRKPHLDETSLRVAWNMKRRYDMIEAEREAEALGAAPGGWGWG